MAQPTARHEGDQGGEEGMAVSQTLLSGSSIRSASVHGCTLSPHVCRSPKDAEMTVMEEILDGGVSRGLTFLHQPLLLSTHPPRAPRIPFDSETHKIQKVRFWCPLLLLIFYPSSDCCSGMSTHWQWGALLSWLFTPPQIFNRSDRSSGLPNPLQCCCALWKRVTVASWHTASAPGGFRHTHHHIQVPSQHVKEVELWVSFNDRCPLLPNGGCRFYTLRLFLLLSSKVQSALKAWPTHSGFFLDFFPPLLSQITFPPHTFPLFFPLGCDLLLISIALPFILFLSGWLWQRLRQLLVTEETALCFYVLSCYRVCVSHAGNSTTLLVVQSEVASIIWSWQTAECERRAGVIVSFPHTPPIHSCPSSLRSGDRVQTDRQPHCCVGAAMSASAHTLSLCSDTCGGGGWRGNIHIHSMTMDAFLNLIWQQGQHNHTACVMYWI